MAVVSERAGDADLSSVLPVAQPIMGREETSVGGHVAGHGTPQYAHQRKAKRVFFKVG